jgi:hypothetical protein
MPTLQIPISTGQLSSAEDSPGTAQIVTNWMLDSLGFNHPRPGIGARLFYLNEFLADQHIIGMYVWTNVATRIDYLMIVNGSRHIYAYNFNTGAISTLSSTAAGTQLDGAGRPTFADDSVNLIIAGGGALQAWDGVSPLSFRLATYTSSVNQPPLGATHVVKVGNYIVANDTVTNKNQFFWSSIGDGNDAVWPPLNFNTADALSDPIVGVFTNLRELYMFGSKTVQVYAIGADANLPFTASSTLQLGTLSPYSIIVQDSQFAFMDANRRFVVTDGRSYQPISTSLDKTLRDLGTVTDCFGFRCLIGWWDLLVWIFPTSQQAFVYDQNGQKWTTWQGWDGISAYTGINIGAYVFDQARNQHLVGSISTTYTMPLVLSEAYNVDFLAQSNGTTTPIVCERVTARIDMGTSVRKRTNWVRFYLRRGAGDANAAIEVSKKDDEGPWSTPQLLDLGAATSDTIGWKEWRPGGIYRRRQYRIRYTGAADTVLTSMEEDYALMTS